MSLYRNPLERFSDFHNHIECSSTALAPNIRRKKGKNGQDGQQGDKEEVT